MKIKERILGIIGQMDFSEYLEEKSMCPECKEQTLVRHIQREKQQKWKGRWYVEHCSDEECIHWDCGFLTKKYKPNKDGYKHIPNESKKIIVGKEND